MKNNDTNIKKIEVKTGQYILLLVFFMLIGVLLIVGFNQQISEKVYEYNNKRKEVAMLEERIANLNILQKEYSQVSDDIEMIENVLPGKDKLVDLISKVETMAEENKLEIDIDFQEEPTTHKFSGTFSVKGYYSDVMKFYNEIYNNEVLATVDAVVMTDTENVKDNTEAQFSMEVYFE